MSAVAEKVSELPDGWLKTTLGDLVEYVTSGSRDWKKFYADKGSAFIRTQNIKTYILDLDDVAYVELPEKVEGKRTRVFKDDLLITITGANVGKVAHVNKEIEEAYVSQSVALVRLKDKNMAPYLYYHLRTRDGASSQLEALAYGMGRPVLNLNNIKEVQINLAPPEQQKRIVAKIEELFSHIDAGIGALKKAKQLLKQYRQSVLKAAVTGELTKEWRKANKDKLEPATQLLERILKERRKKWEEQQLEQFKAKGKMPKNDKWKEKYKELVLPDESELSELPSEWVWVNWETILSNEDGAFKRGPFGSALKKSIFVESGYKVYEQYCPINDDCSFARYYITDEKFEELKSFAVKAGDFLISCSGVTLGRITQVPDDFEEGIINQALLRVRINKDIVDEKYFKMFFRSPYFQGQIFDNVAGVAIPNVKGVKDLKAIPVPLPLIIEQLVIYEKVNEKTSAIDRMESEIDAQLKKAERNKQSILASAFAGKLDTDSKRSSIASLEESKKVLARG
ncbi:MAG: restriction endonuclease subunit S [Candidatus Thiodiazotropha sp. (ex Ctena orbiculata)]|nr:restriction endonuclease subunit S [Candidatus Thiodiazotropha taylori]MBT3034322.1 restriction endonuclease subunit S [Candidatus Thiodiazotropha taylori]